VTDPGVRGDATRPRVVRTRADLTSALSDVRPGNGPVVLVPTMGALHEGHAALLHEARRLAGDGGAVVVSVFVNPLQFAPGEDLDRYPRDLDADLEVCARCGADVVFAPSVDEVYPGGEPQVTVDPGSLAGILDGRSRPGHFRGVLTVVAKLFGLVRPDIAVFGEKDYQQLVLIRRMTADLCLGIEVVGVPTVREPGGLAQSSRNRYLDAEQRLLAMSLSDALRAGAEAAGEGPDHAIAAARAVLRRSHGVDLDYLALTSVELGDPPQRGPARLLVAARVRGTRLIDNMPLLLAGDEPAASETTDSTVTGEA
jgi:pantoate--beta-alanine ligase